MFFILSQINVIKQLTNISTQYLYKYIYIDIHNRMSNEKKIEPYLDPLKFYNHGDNPAMKKFMRIAMENARQGKIIDHRTLIVDNAQRYFLARNFDDFIQRDLSATTFPRAFGIFVIASMIGYTVSKWTRKLLPVGKFGVRNVYQTQFYQNFGPVGLVGVAAMAGGAAYAWYQTTKFTIHKFYQHVLLGERDWFTEQKTWTSQYANYMFSDNLLANDDAYAKSQPKKLAQTLPRFQPTYSGAYGSSKSE